MVYVGNEPTSNFASVTKDLFSGDGSTVAFTLSKASTTNGVAVFVENVRQEPTIAYAVSGTTLTFTAAPVTSSGNNIYVLHHNAVASTANHPAAQDLTAVNGTFTGDITINDGTAADKKILFDGNAQDYHIGLDDSADSLIIGKGSTLGTTPAITIDSSERVVFSNTNRPQFQLGFTNDDMSNVGTTDGTDYKITYTQAITNVGTCVADAGGGTYHTFTAPITGLYLFYANHYTNYTSDDTRTKCMLVVENNTTHNQTLVAWAANEERETSVGLTHPIYLSATDTVDCRMALYDANATSNTFQIYRNRQLSYFGGILIG